MSEGRRKDGTTVKTMIAFLVPFKLLSLYWCSATPSFELIKPDFDYSLIVKYYIYKKNANSKLYYDLSLNYINK